METQVLSKGLAFSEIECVHMMQEGGGSEWAKMADAEEKVRENGEEEESERKGKESFAAGLTLVLVLLSLSESKDEKREKEKESIRKSDNGEVTAKASISKLQPKNSTKTMMLQPKLVRRPWPKSHSSTKDIRSFCHHSSFSFFLDSFFFSLLQ